MLSPGQWTLLAVGGIVVLMEYEGERGSLPVGAVSGGYSPKIIALGQAIAQAEGFNQGPGVIPYDYNNPGDLIDSATGQYRQFSSTQDGWNALFDKLAFDLSGASAIYSPNMTFQQFAWMWVNGTSPGGNLVNASDLPDSWAATVSNAVGFGPTDTLAAYLAS